MSIKPLRTKVTAASDVEALIQKFDKYEQRDAYFQCGVYNGKLTLRFDITFRRRTKREAFTHYTNLITFCNDILRKAKDNSYKYGKVIAYQPCLLAKDSDEEEIYINENEDSIGGLIMFDMAVKSEDIPAAAPSVPKPIAPQALPKPTVITPPRVTAPKPVPISSFTVLDNTTSLTTNQLYAQFMAQWSKVCPGLGPWALVKNENGTYFSCSVSEGLSKVATQGKFKFGVSSYRGFSGSMQGRDGKWLVYVHGIGKDTIINTQTINGQPYRNVMTVFVRHPENGMVQLFLKVAFYKA